MLAMGRPGVIGRLVGKTARLPSLRDPPQLACGYLTDSWPWRFFRLRKAGFPKPQTLNPKPRFGKVAYQEGLGPVR